MNVGARAARPAIKGLANVPYFTNSSILEIDFLPKHLVIVGGSYIGLEFGQMFRRFGSEVTILERASHLASREDEDVSDGICAILRNEGINVNVTAECIEFAKAEDGVQFHAKCGNSSSVLGTHVLLATGRDPNTDDLGL